MVRYATLYLFYYVLVQFVHWAGTNALLQYLDGKFCYPNLKKCCQWQCESRLLNSDLFTVLTPWVFIQTNLMFPAYQQLPNYIKSFYFNTRPYTWLQTRDAMPIYLGFFCTSVHCRCIPSPSTCLIKTKQHNIMIT